MQLKHVSDPFVQPAPVPRQQLATAERANQQEHNYQYYQEYRRLYHTSYLLSFQLKNLTQTKQDLWIKLVKLQKKTQDFKDDIRGQPPERKKRFRRTAQEIQRPYECQVQKCHKCYGSEGSLQQHIKLKHPQLYESKSQHIIKSGQDSDQQYNGLSQQV